MMIIMCRFRVSAAPKILLDPSLSEVTAKVGEPFKIKIPFKGSPVPDATWFNVCTQESILYNFNIFILL